MSINHTENGFISDSTITTTKGNEPKVEYSKLDDKTVKLTFHEGDLRVQLTHKENPRSQAEQRKMAKRWRWNESIDVELSSRSTRESEYRSIYQAKLKDGEVYNEQILDVDWDNHYDTITQGRTTIPSPKKNRFNRRLMRIFGVGFLVGISGAVVQQLIKVPEKITVALAKTLLISAGFVIVNSALIHKDQQKLARLYWIDKNIRDRGMMHGHHSIASILKGFSTSIEQLKQVNNISHNESITTILRKMSHSLNIGTRTIAQKYLSNNQELLHQESQKNVDFFNKISLNLLKGRNK